MLSFQGVKYIDNHSIHFTVVAMRSGEQTDSEEKCRQWSAVYYMGRAKAESPLSQGPQTVFVNTLYTLSVLAQTHPQSP